MTIDSSSEQQSSLEIRETNDPAAISALRDEWRKLLERTPGANFFQSSEWLETYWRFFGAGQKLRLLTAHRHGELAGILPLTIRREQTRLGRVKVLTYPLHDWGSFYGPIARDTTAVLAAGLAHIRRTRREWELLDLRWIDRENDAANTPQAMAAAGFAAHEAPWAQTALVATSGPWEAYLAERTPKFRSTLRRYEKKMASLGAVTFERYRPGVGGEDPRWDLYDACLNIAEQSWQGASTTGTTLSHPSVREYLRQTHAAAARCGAVEMNLLRLDGRPIGFCYNYFFNGYSFGLRKGNLPEYSRDGASMVLSARVLEDSFQRGDRLYDMGPGSIDFKDRWMTRLATCYRYAHYPWMAPKAQMLRLKHWWRKTHPETQAAAQTST